jgi:hypothetical protein
MVGCGSGELRRRSVRGLFGAAEHDMIQTRREASGGGEQCGFRYSFVVVFLVDTA